MNKKNILIGSLAIITLMLLGHYLPDIRDGLLKTLFDVLDSTYSV